MQLHCLGSWNQMHHCYVVECMYVFSTAVCAMAKYDKRPPPTKISICDITAW